jgi:hypothetical protein
VTATKDPTTVLENRKEAWNTFVEQTKLLVTLASAFVRAPPALKIILELRIDLWVFIAEALFVLSVLSGYFALATITGSQFEGEFNVYRKAARLSDLAQFFSYLLGLCGFLYWVFSKAVSPATSHEVEVRVLGQKNATSTGTRVDVDAFTATT